MLTGFGIYFVIVFILNSLCSVVYIARGGVKIGPGALAFALLWSTFNLWGLFHWGLVV